MKLHPSGAIESVSVRLSEDKTPVAFRNKVQELVEAGMTESEARKFVLETPFVLEIYYEKGYGLFAVESDTLEGCAESICSPYSQEFFEDNED